MALCQASVKQMFRSLGLKGGVCGGFEYSLKNRDDQLSGKVKERKLAIFWLITTLEAINVSL